MQLDGAWVEAASWIQHDETEPERPGWYPEDTDSDGLQQGDRTLAQAECGDGSAVRLQDRARQGSGGRPRGAREFPGPACCSSFLGVRKVCPAPSHPTMNVMSARRDFFPAAGVNHRNDLMTPVEEEERLLQPANRRPHSAPTPGLQARRTVRK